MKTIEMKIFNFEELNMKAKERAILEYRDKEIDVTYIYEDAYASLKEFNKIFDLKEDSRDFLYLNTDRIENDNILSLNGLRLQKFIYNNFANVLFKEKYIGSLNSNKKNNHPRIKSKKLSNGEFSNAFYSKITKENFGILTGTCYDNDLLDPIYDFLKLRVFDKKNFKELLQNCYDNLKKSIDTELDYIESDKNIEEKILEHGYFFLATGEKFLNGIDYIESDKNIAEEILERNYFFLATGEKFLNN
jgi:hypothetical protein